LAKENADLKSKWERLGSQLRNKDSQISALTEKNKSLTASIEILNVIIQFIANLNKS